VLPVSIGSRKVKLEDPGLGLSRPRRYLEIEIIVGRGGGPAEASIAKAKANKVGFDLKRFIYSSC
jgi:hypothetical protein